MAEFTDDGERQIHKSIKQIYLDAGILKPPYKKVLALNDLYIDQRYQRESRDYHIARLTKNFRPQSVQFLVVALRPDGRYFLIDGNHRRLALIQMGATHWDCEVFEGLTFKQEDQMWLDLQRQHLAPRTYEVFHARLSLGDEIAHAVRRCVEMVGGELHLKDKPRRTNRQIRCVASVETIFRQGGGPSLTDTLGFLFSIFSEDELEATEAVALEAMFLLLHVLGPECGLDRDRLRRVLEKYGLKRVMRDADGMAATSAQRSRNTRFLSAVAALYNNGLRRNRIDVPVDSSSLISIIKRRKAAAVRGLRVDGTPLQ